MPPHFSGTPHLYHFNAVSSVTWYFTFPPAKTLAILEGRSLLPALITRSPPFTLAPRGLPLLYRVVSSLGCSNQPGSLLPSCTMICSTHHLFKSPGGKDYVSYTFVCMDNTCGNILELGRHSDHTCKMNGYPKKKRWPLKG